MLLKNFLPGSILRGYVKNFGIVHFVFSEKANIPVKLYSPRPGDCIEFCLREPEYVLYPGQNTKTKRPSAVIMGQHHLAMKRYIGNEFLYLNITFQPGILFRLTGIPAYELVNTYIDAESVFSKEIKTIEERLRNAESYAEMISLAESYVLTLICKTKRAAHSIETAAKIILQNTEPATMDWLAKEACLCSKQFERKFKERMGVSPSLYARIVRFNRALMMKNHQQETNWLSIALQCRYYDYQHLVRDFKAFTGLTPTSLFDLEDQAPERMLGLHE